MGSNANATGGDYFVGAASIVGTGDGDVLYTSGDVSKYNYHVIQNTAGEVMDVYASVDGTNFALVWTQDTQAASTATSVIEVAAGEIGILRGKFKKVRVQQGAIGTPPAGEVIVAHGVE